MTGSQSGAERQGAVDFNLFSFSFPSLIFPKRNPSLTVSSSGVKEPDLEAVVPDGD